MSRCLMQWSAVLGLLIAGRPSNAQQNCPAVDFYIARALDSYPSTSALGFIDMLGSYTGYSAEPFTPFNSTPMPQLKSQLTPCFANPLHKNPPDDAPAPGEGAQPGQLVGLADLTGASDFGAVYAAGWINNTGDLSVYALGPGTTNITSTNYTLPGELGEVVLFADVNGDHIPDIVTANLVGSNSNVVILLGKGDGSFGAPASYPTNGATTGITAADVNGDGKIDLVVSGSGGTEIRIGHGDGTFAAPAMIPAAPNGALGSAATVGDFNGDGKADLGIASNAGLLIYLGNGDGTFRAPTVYNSGLGSTVVPCLASADLNRDGFLDIVTCDNDISGFSVWLGKGDGTFKFVNSYESADAPDSIILTDFDGDGNLDIVGGSGSSLGFSGLSNDGENLTVLYGNGDGTFLGLPWSSYHATQWAVGDVNGDGKPDLIGGGPSGIATFLGGAPALVPGKTTAASLNGIAAADFTGDGKIDVAGSTATGVTLYTGNGDGSFTAGAATSLQNAGMLLAGDWNGDGKPDIIVFPPSNGTPQITVLLNKGSSFSEGATYTFASGLNLASWAAGDFNGDGKLDLALVLSSFANPPPSTAGVAILYGNGDGTFGSPLIVPGTQSAVAVAAGDLNQDALADLVVTTNSTGSYGIRIYLGSSSGTFVSGPVLKTGFGAGQAVLADFNGDGHIDMLLPQCCGASVPATLMLGNGDGTFAAPTAYLSMNSIDSALAADFNGDGLPDVAVFMSTPHVFGVAINEPRQAPALTVVSAATFTAGPVAPDSIVTLFGSGLASGTASAQSTPLPATLAGTSIDVLDANGSMTASPLFYASPQQINAYLPAGVATGTATFTVIPASGVPITGPVQVASVAPGLFLANSQGLAAGQGEVLVNGSLTPFNLYTLDANNNVVAQPVNLSQGTVFLTLFGTGIRNADPTQVTAQIGGVAAMVMYAGPQGIFVGLDQVNVQVPPSLAGRGDVTLTITAAGVVSNAAHVTFQ